MSPVRPATRWSVPQTIAWILAREESLVSQLSVCSGTLADLRRNLADRFPPPADLRSLANNAAAELVEELGRTNLSCIGSRVSGGVTQTIPADNWPGLKIVDTCKERLSLNFRLSIKSSAEAVYAVPRGLNLRGTYRDMAPYCDEKGVITFWTDLSLSIAEVKAVWPAQPASLTGCAGRPDKSRSVFEGEMRRRAIKGVLAPTLVAEVQALLAWAHGEISPARMPKPKTLQNSLRQTYLELKDTRPK